MSYSSNSKVLKYSPSLTFVWVIIRFAFVKKIFPRQHSEQALVLMNILSCLSALSMLLQHSLGSDQTQTLLFIELFLQFLQLLGSKLVWTLANGFSARLKIDNELNWPVRRHTRKLFWEDIFCKGEHDECSSSGGIY